MINKLLVIISIITCIYAHGSESHSHGKRMGPKMCEIQGIIVDSTIDSVYEGLEKILNKSNLKQLRNNARRLIQEKFLVEKLIKKYEEMYISAINQNSSLKK